MDDIDAVTQIIVNACMLTVCVIIVGAICVIIYRSVMNPPDSEYKVKQRRAKLKILSGGKDKKP